MPHTLRVQELSSPPFPMPRLPLWQFMVPFSTDNLCGQLKICLTTQAVPLHREIRTQVSPPPPVQYLKYLKYIKYLESFKNSHSLGFLWHSQDKQRQTHCKIPLTSVNWEVSSFPTACVFFSNKSSMGERGEEEEGPSVYNSKFEVIYE